VVAADADVDSVERRRAAGRLAYRVCAVRLTGRERSKRGGSAADAEPRLVAAPPAFFYTNTFCLQGCSRSSTTCTRSSATG
jgi:hypothetical protein